MFFHVFFHRLRIMIPTDFLHFFRGVGLNHQPEYLDSTCEHGICMKLMSCVKWVPKSEKKRSQWPYFQCPLQPVSVTSLRFPGRLRHQPPLARQRWKLEGGGGGCDEDLQIQRKGAGCWEATPVTADWRTTLGWLRKASSRKLERISRECDHNFQNNGKRQFQYYPVLVDGVVKQTCGKNPTIIWKAEPTSGTTNFRDHPLRKVYGTMVLVTAKSMNGGSANTSTEFVQDLRSLMASADDFVRTKTATVCLFFPQRCGIQTSAILNWWISILISY